MENEERSKRIADHDPESLPETEEHGELIDRLDRLWKSPNSSSPRSPASPDLSVALKDLPILLGDRYELGDCIGSGSFGQVYFAIDKLNQGPVAIKIPRLEVLLASEQFDRFRREAEIAKQLDHEGIVPVLDCCFKSEVPFIVMRWCNGIDLGQFLQDIASTGPSVSWRVAAETLAKIARAVGYAHQQGITHRDLKPSNILLELPPGSEKTQSLPKNLAAYQPRVTDFGLAHFVDISVADTRSSVLIGTPMYLAPEQIERCVGAEKEVTVTHSSDIYALGMILFEILAGRTCYDGSSWFSVIDSIRSGRKLSLRTIRPDLPKTLTSICECCLSSDPAGRYGSAFKLAEDLEACCKGTSVNVPKRTLRQRLKYFRRQAKRIDQAGSFTLIVQLVVALSVFGTALVKSIGFPVRLEKSVTQFWVEFLFLALLIHVPLCWIGLKTLNGSYRAVWIGFLANIFLLFVQLSLVAVIASNCWPFEFVPLYADEPGTSKVVYVIMTLVFGCQLMLFWLAIPAARGKLNSR